MHKTNRKLSILIVSLLTIQLCLPANIVTAAQNKMLAPSSRVKRFADICEKVREQKQKKAYLDLYTQAEMNPRIAEAFDKTGKYQVMDKGASDPAAYGAFGMGGFVTEKNRRDEMAKFVLQAKEIMEKDAKYPYKKEIRGARIVAVEGLPYDGHYGTGGAGRGIPSAYIPWDVMEYLFERHNKGDPNALYELADFIFHEVTEPIRAEEIKTGEKLSPEESKTKAHNIVSHARGFESVISNDLREKFANARANLTKELKLRKRVTQAKAFGRRLRIVCKGRNLTEQEFGKRVGVSLRTVRRWMGNENMPQPSHIKKIEAGLDFPIDILLYGKPLAEAIREPGLNQFQRFDMVRYTRGLSSNDIKNVYSYKKEIPVSAALRFGKILDIDMNLVLYGKYAWERIRETIGLPWGKRPPLTAVELGERYRKFFTPIDETHCRILSREGFMDRWGINIRFEAIDVLDKKKVEDTASAGKSNLIVARNVHYHTQDKSEDADKKVLEILLGILKDNGLISIGYGSIPVMTKGLLRDSGASGINKGDIDAKKAEEDEIGAAL